MRIPRWTKAAVLALALTGAPTIDARTEPKLDKEALLYDLSLGWFSTKKSATRAEHVLKHQLADPLLQCMVHVRKRDERPQYQVRLDLNADKRTADAMAGEIAPRMPERPFVELNPYFYSSKETAGRYANIRINDSESFIQTIAKFTTAFGDDVGETKRSLLNSSEYQKRGFSKKVQPRSGDLVPIPVRFLRDAYQLGMEEGVDVHRVEIKNISNQRTLWDIASNFTEGDVSDNVDALARFNDLKQDELSSLRAGTPILIPATIYRDPAKPTIIQEIEDESVVIHRQRPESKKPIDRALEERIPEFKDARIDASKIMVHGSPFYVLRKTHMPAVLLEGWNLKNREQTLHYDKKENLDDLIQRYADGVAQYDAGIEGKLELVIIDDGHGNPNIDSGTRATFNGKTYREGDFTRKIQRGVAARLKARGLDVVELSYNGKPGKKGMNRLNYFVKTANNALKKHGLDQSEALYLAIHIDAHRSPKSKPLPRAHVYRHPDKQPLSAKAAQSILSYTSALKSNGFR